MKLYIEIIVMLSIMGLIVFWLCWNKISQWIALKRYKPENDKGRKHQKDTKGGAEPIDSGERAVKEPVADSTGPGKSAGPELLPQAEADSDGKTGDGGGKNGNGIRKLLSRRKKE